MESRLHRSIAHARRAALRSALALTVTLALGGAAAAADLHVAVAANFSGPLQQLAPLYERGSGHHLLISAGSSGQLATQIRQGAPFDVFLSADVEKPEQLEREGLTVAGSRCIYAIGTLVLWSPQAGLVDQSGEVLASQRFHLLGIANPQTAPYGSAAQQVLQHLKLWDTLNTDHRIVTGENITQTWQFAASGGADLAFVALSQVIGTNGHIEGSSWLPPQSLYSPIEQGAVALAASQQSPAAQSFLHWLRNDPEALDVIHAAGYRSSP
jgi:molybdate transport system substrate-binding protein